ncbi:NAD(P)/FAD-dependent oxidoreductase [Gaetbulibacter saemankumensis]|uniref:NAD(P)/FAD-dependent oxidoreductase n=1 Tax=Gaetbulibacter saemankumensis TaxID=311208 RepID=UPI0004257074|nr:FAD-dependent oxidoreductase [Gaetbulibacter saemankumensis]
MNLSYWEIKSWLSAVDFTIVGSGIVGLSTALFLKEQYPKSKILVLERGTFPQGASTKNAGFACFGSLSEIINDLTTHSEEEVFQLVRKRVQGLSLLRQSLGDNHIGFKNYGGYELFLKDDTLFETCTSKIAEINGLLEPLFNKNVFSFKSNEFSFKNIESQYVFNPFEGQIDTGKMMNALIKKVQSQGVKILNNISVERFSDALQTVNVKTNAFEFTTSKLLIATNGFAGQLINQPIKPARAQVLITKPIKNLTIKGTFHLDQGYYYFRNIDNRILLGGGRNLDFKGEETTELGQTKQIQNALKNLLETTILSDIPFEIDYSWSGIMGVGNRKQAIVKPISKNVFCGVRLGGMGVAIGSLIGKELAQLSGD